MSNEAGADAPGETGRVAPEAGRPTTDQSAVLELLQHDLRNPLHVAAANVSLAAQDCDSDRLEAAAAALDRLDGVIAELPRLAGIDDPVSTREPVCLGSVARRSWQDLESGDASLVVDGRRRVMADPACLERLLRNLLRNAVTYGGQGVTVRIGVLGAGVGFFVADDGPGIPPADRERVLEQGYATARDAAGFGLFIVARLARAHGWAVRVTSGSEGGARIEVAGVDVLPEDG